MIDRIRQLFSMTLNESQAVSEVLDVRLAVAAIMVHVSLADGQVDARERAVLERVLAKEFDIKPAELDELITRAEAAEHNSVGLYEFTSVLKQHYAHEEMDQVILLLWQMVYADGELHDFEANIVWRVAELLGVSARNRMLLKKQVAQGQTPKNGHD